MAREAKLELEQLISGRRFTVEQLEAIRSSVVRGDIDTIAHAAAGGIALAIEIIRKYEQETKRRSS
jgi:hypothetical protein